MGPGSAPRAPSAAEGWSRVFNDFSDHASSVKNRRPESPAVDNAALPRNEILWYATRAVTSPTMLKKPNQKTFHLNAIIDGRIIRGYVAFSPAPQSGILTEVARFDAERLLTHLIRQEISHGGVCQFSPDVV